MFTHNAIIFSACLTLALAQWGEVEAKENHRHLPPSPFHKLEKELTEQHESIKGDLSDIKEGIAMLQETVDDLQPSEPEPLCGEGTEGQRFVVSEDGTEVCDNTTGLFWEQKPDDIERTWEEALAYCPTLGTGYHLPAVKELTSLVDWASELQPLLPEGHPFDNVQGATSDARYFTSTPGGFSAIGIPLAWVVNFRIGNVEQFFQPAPGFVWCARGGQSIDGQALN